MNRSSADIRRHGFTLIELMVVIGIIIVLVGILIPTLGHVNKQAKGTATQSRLSDISKACDTYNADFRAYPGIVRDTVWQSTPNATTAATRTNPAVSTTSVFTSTQSLYASLNMRWVNGTSGTVANSNSTLTSDQIKILFGTTNASISIPSDDWVKVTFNTGDPILGTAAPAFSASLDPRDQPIDKSGGKVFGAYLAVKPAETSDAITRTVSGKTVPVFDVPAFIDSAYKTQALPFLYFRQDAKPTSQNKTTVSLARNYASSTNRAAFYYNAHKDFESVSATDYPQLKSSGLDKFNADDDGSADHIKIFTKSVSQTVSGFDVPRGEYVLISAGADRQYGTSDDIIVSGGN